MPAGLCFTRLKIVMTESFRMLLDSPGFLIASQTASIDDKGTVARSIAMNFVVYTQKAELDEIKSGFQCLNFSGLVKSHPNLLKPLFVAGGRKKLTAASLNSLLKEVTKDQRRRRLFFTGIITVQVHIACMYMHCKDKLLY